VMINSKTWKDHHDCVRTLSLGVQRAQLEQRTGLTWPRPFLLRPLRNQLVLWSLYLRIGRIQSPILVVRQCVVVAVSIFELYVRVRHCGDVEWDTASPRRVVGLTCSPSS
jgi:hypothetical protein